MPKTIAILIKESAMEEDSLRSAYLELLKDNGIPEEEVVVLPLLYNTSKKVVAKTGKAYLDKLLDRIPDTVTRLIIADSFYFKFITKIVKISSTYGKVVKGAYDGYTDFDCVYVPNYKSLFKQPENAQLIEVGISKIGNKSTELCIESSQFALEFNQDHALYDQLYQYSELTIDVETTGLSLESKIISISFSWSETEGVSIDLEVNGYYHLKRFLETYQGICIYHNALYDCKLLIRQLWMDHPQDIKGMNEGLKYFHNIEDTMLLAYLEKNATTQISLSLKDCALEHVGNYALEIENIRMHTKKEILSYNLVDTLGTFYLWNKYKHQRESEAYREIFQPSIALLLKCMIVGLPLDNEAVKNAHETLSEQAESTISKLQNNQYVREFTQVLQQEACDKKNLSLKKLRKTIDDFKDLKFNHRSNTQLGKFLHDFLGLPVLETTKTGAPSTGADILGNLRNHTTDEDIISALDMIIELVDIEKINGTFISAFLKEKDFLHGNLKLGGTQSGRLSSSEP